MLGVNTLPSVPVINLLPYFNVYNGYGMADDLRNVIIKCDFYDPF